MSEPPSIYLLQELRGLVAAHRKRRGLSQTDLAHLAGVGRRFVSELERGAKPNLRLDKVDAVLGVFHRRLGVVELPTTGRRESPDD